MTTKQGSAGMRIVAWGSILIMLASSWGLAAAGGRDPVSQAQDGMGQVESGELVALDDAPGLREGAEVQEAAAEQLDRPISNPLMESLKTSGRESAGIRTIRLLEKDDPLGLLEANEETGAWEVAEGTGDIFDGVVRESGRLGDQQFADAMKATKDCPELWAEGRLSNFLPDQLPAAARLYLDMRALGVPKGGTIAVVGESMKLRVNPFAATLRELGFETRTFETDLPQGQWMEQDRQWIRDRIANHETVVDIGPQEGRANYPGATSPYYQMELNELKGYAGFKDYRGRWR